MPSFQSNAQHGTRCLGIDVATAAVTRAWLAHLPAFAPIGVAVAYDWHAANLAAKLRVSLQAFAPIVDDVLLGCHTAK